MPNFEEIWPSNKDKNDKYKRRLIGMEYYLDAMEHHGLKGHLPQPENFTTCGKLGIEINQYNCPIEVGNHQPGQTIFLLTYFPPQCYDEAVIEEMTEDREMLTNPDLVEARKELKTVRGENPLVAQKMMKFDPSKSNILSTLAAEEGQKVTRTA